MSSAPSADWTAVACSADGTNLVGVTSYLPPYRSTDSGLTWAVTSAPSTNWAAVASSADGKRIAAVVDGGGIYILETASALSLSIAKSGNSLLISWIASSMKSVLQERAESGTWSDVRIVPVLNYTNLQYEVRVPTPESPRFYRLVTR